MSEFKGTPGPWEVSSAPKTRTRGIDIRATGRPKIVASIHWPFGDWNEDAQAKATANARLIAAAPELLKCLQAVVSHAEDDPALEAQIHLDICRAAIAKATGGDQ